MHRSLASIAALATAALTSLPVFAQNANPPPPAPPPPPVEELKNAPTLAEQQFVADAAKDGMTEVTIGQLALQQGESPSVKAFGRHLVEDHSKADDQLRQIARTDGIPVPAVVGSEQRKEIAKLQKLHGAGFDKEFTSFMIRAHKAAIDRFEKAAADGDIKDPALKRFASDTVPTLEHHLDLARGAKAQVKTEK